MVFVGGSRKTSPSLDLIFPPTGLSENLGGMERGRGGKGEREGWGDHLPYFPPHWLLSQIPPCHHVPITLLLYENECRTKNNKAYTGEWWKSIYQCVYSGQHESWCTALDDPRHDEMMWHQYHDTKHTDRSHSKQGTWTANLKSYSSCTHRS